MWDYHSRLVATHSFSSKFYSWPFVHLPVWFYSGEPSAPGLKQTIVMMGNPLVWWATIPALFGLFYSRTARVYPQYVLLALAFLSQYVPWIIASRITFQYHYFAPAVFGVILVAIVLDRMAQVKPWVRGLYVAGVIACFALFWPAIVGFDVSESYVSKWLRWFPNWYF
jgi:dolichyl-phosphate-mannose--protein O-mannosyl transferase